jgi:LPXTG-motif cell wall-anchored protein
MCSAQTTIGGVLLGSGIGTAVSTKQGVTSSLPKVAATELARTGAGSTVTLAAVAILLLLMGVLLVGLARRHRDLGSFSA